jgi:excisionase family DNA binding protein
VSTKIENADPLLTREEAAEYLGVSVRTIDRLMADDRLKPTRLPGVRGTKFRRSRLDALLTEDEAS